MRGDDLFVTIYLRERIIAATKTSSKLSLENKGKDDRSLRFRLWIHSLRADCGPLCRDGGPTRLPGHPADDRGLFLAPLSLPLVHHLDGRPSAERHPRLHRPFLRHSPRTLPLPLLPTPTAGRQSPRDRQRGPDGFEKAQDSVRGWDGVRSDSGRGGVCQRPKVERRAGRGRGERRRVTVFRPLVRVRCKRPRNPPHLLGRAHVQRVTCLLRQVGGTGGRFQDHPHLFNAPPSLSSLPSEPGTLDGVFPGGSTRRCVGAGGIFRVHGRGKAVHTEALFQEVAIDSVSLFFNIRTHSKKLIFL